MVDTEIIDNNFLKDVLAGLSGIPKSMPCKYLYDKRGSELFDRICGLKEYYLTRVELEIMNQYAGEMSSLIGAHAVLIEFGSGSSLKTRLLLDVLPQPSAYIPVDISSQHLADSVRSLSAEFPQIHIIPLDADFTNELTLPKFGGDGDKRVVYFPGSTIGNFAADEAVELLKKIAVLVGVGGGLLIGVDLVKDKGILESAYNDSEGITAQFNLNILRRLNRELNAEIQIDQFKHYAFYDFSGERIEIHLESITDQVIKINEHEFEILAGETIHTENSHKYRIDGFEQLAKTAGFNRRKVWVDAEGLFSVQYFVVN